MPFLRAGHSIRETRPAQCTPTLGKKRISRDVRGNRGKNKSQDWDEIPHCVSSDCTIRTFVAPCFFGFVGETLDCRVQCGVSPDRFGHE